MSEISDFLPTVERQIGVDGPIERFASIPESDDLFLRGTIERVEPWFAIAGELVRAEDGRTITDSGERRIADYADPDALWQFSKVHVRIADDFGEPDFDADRITARMRFPIEDVEPYVGTDSLIFASTPYFDPPWQRRDDVEWTASGIVPIRADGTIAWHEQQQDVVGRATTIGALESIAERGEIVVTEGRANPPVVIERTARTDR